MTSPALLYGFCVATILGAAFHLWKDGGIGFLLFYILLSWTGFWLGHVIGENLDCTFWSVGTLNVGTGSIGSMILLLVGYWLSLVKE